MDLGLKNKTALVTAASQGLGRAIAVELAKEGCTLTISSRNREKLILAEQFIIAQSDLESTQIHSITADVTKSDDISQLIQQSFQRMHNIDLLVTNAGGPPAGTFEQLTDEQWLTAVNQNLMSVIRLIRTSLPFMRQNGGGKILNVSSVVKGILIDPLTQIRTSGFPLWPSCSCRVSV